jgi:hypothetical protein
MPPGSFAGGIERRGKHKRFTAARAALASPIHTAGTYPNASLETRDCSGRNGTEYSRAVDFFAPMVLPSSLMNSKAIPVPRKYSSKSFDSHVT